MGVFRVEASPNNRAGCSNKECKDAKIKIMKGEFRYAIQITIDEHQSWQYRHWGCVTPKQITNLIDACGCETDLVDGYDELPAEYQEKVKFALENKHIPDEDWKGDPEKNRSGQTGFRLTKAQAKKKAKEAAANGDDDNDDDDDTEEKPKKKRGRKPKPETEDDASELEAPAPKKKGGRAVKQEDVEEEAPAQKKRGRPSKKEVNDDEEVPPLKKARAARGKRVQYKEEDDDDEAPPPKKVKGKKSTVKKEVEERDDGMGEDAETEEDAEVAKPKPGRKKTAPVNGEAKAPQKKGRKKATAETD